MSFVYFKFLFVNTIKRKPVWITWLLFIFTCSCFLIILPAAAKMNTLQVWANTTMAFCQTFMGMMAALFTAVLAVNVFKDTNEEGTELIIMSKPISRFKIVVTKFWLFGLFCLMINLSTVFLTVFTIFLPRTEMQFYSGLLISMFIGNLITFAIFGSISILLTVKFAKIGVIVTNIIISLVLLIYQILTLFVFDTPSVILDHNGMSVSTYILHNRNTETGEYIEDEVVKFDPVSEETQKTKCTATDWKSMKDFWQKDIMGKDITPVLNVTDLASQFSLSYLSYNTEDFAYRQAKRSFATSRFYNYELTNPASPEILNQDKSINWIYTSFEKFNIPDLSDVALYIPSVIGFAGIKPLTSTKLRGYTDLIPVGTVKSKEFLSTREVLFEPNEWKKYKEPFDDIYNAIFDYRNYSYLSLDPSNWLSAFCSNNDQIAKYYNLVWACLTGNAGDTQYGMNADVYNQYLASKHYDKTTFEITDINDLNNRFIQFKNFVYYKALHEQQQVIDGYVYDGPSGHDNYESKARQETIDRFKTYLEPLPVLGVTYTDGSWMVMGNSSLGFLGENVSIPSYNLLTSSYDAEKKLIKPLSLEEQNDWLSNSALAKIKKAGNLFKNVVLNSETYLYIDLQTPTRTNKYSGQSFAVSDTWYPNLNGAIGQQLEINAPLGQNMQYFFYKTTPILKYWMFAIIWGTISIGLFASGIVVYNKYDVK